MTDEEINITIARHFGWEPCEPRVFLRFAPSHAFMKDGAYYGGLAAIPNYCRDLNATHEAEQHLTDIEADRYAAALAIISDRDACKHNRARQEMLWACTARQRAEALYAILSKR